MLGRRCSERLAEKLFVKHVWTKIDAVWPFNGATGFTELDLGECLWVFQRREDAALAYDPVMQV